MAITAAIGGSNDFLNHMFDDTIDGIDAADGRSFARQNRSNRRGRNDYEDSTWGRMLTDDKDQLQNYNSDETKLFKFRFRVPYKLYEILLEWTVYWIEYKEKATNCSGRPRVEVLRILGRGACLDGIKEWSSMSETMMWKFFYGLCNWFREEIHPR